MIILDLGTTFSNHICKFITICDYVYCSTNIFNLTLMCCNITKSKRKKCLFKKN